MNILLDFDGTCVEHDFPRIGKDIGAVPVLKDLIEAGHNLILFTMRGTGPKSDFLTPALSWFAKHEIPLYGIQYAPGQGQWTNSPKAYGDLIIDDNCLGIPLRLDSRGVNCVYWDGVRALLTTRNIL